MKLKARHIKKIRAEVKWYQVAASRSLFGWPYSEYWTELVMARSEKNAIQRIKKKCGESTAIDETTEKWGKWKVKESGKPEHHKYIKYY